MSWNQHQINLEGGLLSHYQRSLLSSSSPSPSPSPSLPDNSDYQKQSSSGSRISPAVIFIIVILAVIFFISGLVHLLVRFLIKHRSSSSLSESNRFPDMSGSGAFQRQLQQLFHLHDSGLDQAFIDALPVFLYQDIVGLKEPFDCAVCLCEFSEKDRLRLLPLCSHAFHVDCIDTWLLSNSTCPLCRGTLFTPGFPIENPVFYLEEQREEDICSSNTANAVSISQKPTESEIIHSKRVFSVRLGKFRSSNGGVGEKGEGETSSSNMEARRCYSMGSYQYVVADLDLQVALCQSRGATGAVSLNIGKGRSGQGGNSSIEGDIEGKKINIRSKGESFSVSKIWQWSRKGKFPSSSENHTGPSSVTVSFPWNDDHTQDTRW